jgi:predicted transcriptional regulator
MKQKKEKFPYKIIRPEQVDELRSKSTDELLKEYLLQNKKIQIVLKQKKDDSKLKEIAGRIKDHRNSSAELTEAKEDLKDLKSEVDDEIRDDIEDKKSLEGGYRDEIRGFKETIHAIQSIIDRRSQ